MAIESTLTQSDLILLSSLLYLFLVGTYILWKRKFFYLPTDTPVLNRAWHQVLAVFILYLGTQSILAPALWMGVMKSTFEAKLTVLEQAQINAFSLFVSAILVITYAGFRQMFRSVQPTPAILCFAKGALTWFLSYPAMMMVSQVISLAVAHFYSGPLPDQVAVEHLKATQDHPFLFQMTLLEVTFLVPIVEEILFRGYLQGWLRSWLGRWWGIGVSSLIFAFFHYSASQEIFNIELIASLFVLACYLGFLYEKYQNIWAPIGLHAIFNTISVIMILNA